MRGLLHPIDAQTIAELGTLFAVCHGHLAEHVTDQDLLQLVDFLAGVDVRAFDLLLDILLFVGQVIVGISHTLHIRVFFQLSQNILDVPFQFHHVHVELVGQQNAQVMRCGGESVDMLNQQQHLQQAHTQLLYIGAESLFGLVDAEVRG